MMSNAYGSGSPAAGLNAPGNMPPWLMNLWNYVNPMSQATAGGVDAQGRPLDAITAANQALATRALNGGPQASGPIARSQAANVATTLPPAPIQAGPPGPGNVGPVNGFLPQQPYPDLMFPNNRLGTNPIQAAALANAPSRRPIPPPAPPPYNVTAQPGQTGTPYQPPYNVTAQPGQTGTPYQPPIKPRARQLAAAAPQVPWITTERQNLPAGNGPLGRNAQTKQGMLDLSKLFNRTG